MTQPKDHRAKSQADRLELLAQSCEQLEECRLGNRALWERIEDLRGGYPSGGEGGPSEGVGRLGKPDPAASIENRYDDQLRRVWREVGKLASLHREHVEARHGVTLLSDPGCGLCAQISSPTRPVHAPTWLSVCVAHRLARCLDCDNRKPPKARQPVCNWCHLFTKKTGRVPSIDERRAHHEGRRVRVTA